MLTRKEFIQNHWKYYLMLESKFISTTNYVELSTDNFDTFSNEYASLIQLIGAELDCFFKEYCGFNKEDIKNISDYARYILADYADIKNQEISITDYDIGLKPFETWDASRAKQSLPWWEAFDKIKHNRVDNKNIASLRNVLDILGALFLIEMKYLKKISEQFEVPDIPDDESKIFSLKNWDYKYLSMEDAFFHLVDNASSLFNQEND